jgi:hypothetical protein
MSAGTDMSANDADSTLDNAAHGGCPATTCYALCACGCGQPIKKSRRPDPSKYLRGHCPTANANLTNRGFSEAAQKKAAEAFANNPVMKKGTGHINSRSWQIRSPRGRTYRFKNLREFIRRNAELFAPEDAEWRTKPDGDSTCKAFTGIAGISIRLNNPRGSWKGWTWYSQVEKLHNDGRCLLGRDDSQHNVQAVAPATLDSASPDDVVAG